MSGEPNQIERILNVEPSKDTHEDWGIEDAIETEVWAEPQDDTVPDLIGLIREDAKREATRKGYRVNTNPPESETTTEWRVADQKPKANSHAPEDPKDRKMTIYLKNPRQVGDG